MASTCIQMRPPAAGCAAVVNVSTCTQLHHRRHCPESYHRASNDDDDHDDDNNNHLEGVGAQSTTAQLNQIPIPCLRTTRRRLAALICYAAVPLTTITSPILLPLASPAAADAARERRSKNLIPLDQYRDSPEGLKYYDIVVGKGPIAERGSTVQVHFDCIYRGVTAVSSRESKLLAGNRIIAQPYEFKVGSAPGKERKRDFVDNPNGLFSAQAAPKPPPAMYTVTEGMRVGGKRTVIVTPEVGYGKKGMSEIPSGATFDLNIELLRIVPVEGK